MNKNYQFTVIDLDTRLVKWTAPFATAEEILTNMLEFSLRNENWAMRVAEIAPPVVKLAPPVIKVGDTVRIINMANGKTNDTLAGQTGIVIKIYSANIKLTNMLYYTIDLDIPYRDSTRQIVSSVGRSECEIELVP